MPELPEVETVRRSLETKLVGKKFTGINLVTGKIIKEPQRVKDSIIYHTITEIRRRGKYLIIVLEHESYMVVHLRMTGRLVWQQDHQPVEKHTHVIFFLDDGSQLRYIDIRQFGTIDVYRSDKEMLKTTIGKLGPEPLSNEFTLEYLMTKLKNKKQPIKSTLLDQTVIAGLGNIYVDEALFRAGINPQVPSNEIAYEPIAKLVEEVKAVIALGIKHRGTSFRDYVDGEGKTGSFQNYLLVYGLAGEPCKYCGRELSKIRVGGRGTVYCSNCQKFS